MKILQDTNIKTGWNNEIAQGVGVLKDKNERFVIEIKIETVCHDKTILKIATQQLINQVLDQIL